MYVGILPACIAMCHAFAVPLEAGRGRWILPELELQMVVSSPVGSGN